MIRNIAVIPFYWTKDPERREITERIFHHYRKVEDRREDIIFLGLGSEGPISKEVWSQHFPRTRYREYSQTGPLWGTPPNASGSEGLRDKYNASIAFARDMRDHYPDVDRIWFVQSDDLITSGFFDPSDADLVGIGHGPGGGCLWWKYPGTEHYWWSGVFPGIPPDHLQFCGGNVGYSIPLLDQMNWTPYQLENDEQGMERWAKQLGATLEPRMMAKDGFLWWLVKGRQCLNPWDLTIHGVRVFDRFDFYPAPVEEVSFLHQYWDTL